MIAQVGVVNKTTVPLIVNPLITKLLPLTDSLLTPSNVTECNFSPLIRYLAFCTIKHMKMFA